MKVPRKKCLEAALNVDPDEGRKELEGNWETLVGLFGKTIKKR